MRLLAEPRWQQSCDCHRQRTMMSVFACECGRGADSARAAMAVQPAADACDRWAIGGFHSCFCSDVTGARQVTDYTCISNRVVHIVLILLLLLAIKSRAFLRRASVF